MVVGVPKFLLVAIYQFESLHIEADWDGISLAHCFIGEFHPVDGVVGVDVGHGRTSTIQQTVVTMTMQVDE